MRLPSNASKKGNSPKLPPRQNYMISLQFCNLYRHLDEHLWFIMLGTFRLLACQNTTRSTSSKLTASFVLSCLELSHKPPFDSWYYSVQSPSGELAIRIDCPTFRAPAKSPQISGALQTFPLRFDQLIFPIRAHQQSEESLF